MKTITHFLLLNLALISLSSCKTESKEVTKTNKTKVEKKLNKGAIIINKAINAHGGELYDTASYQFVFRKNTYSFTNTNDSFKYSFKTVTKDKQDVLNILNNDNFSRTINGEKIELSEKDISRYSEALNSVIYFATLPHKLQDKSVNKKFIGNSTIKEQEYEVVKITFKQEGGGKDFEDEYYYWINSKTHTMDYFAYNYLVNGGGVRFRSSYNRRNIDGVIFQDYINYKAEVGTPLADLPALYEQGKLKEISRVDTEKVINLKTKNLSN